MTLDKVMSWFSVDMGIDLGTCNTLVCVRGEGIVLNEPSVVAVRKGTNQVLMNGAAVGFAAKEMLGRTPGSIQAIRPLKDGVISDFEITESMLKYFIQKVMGRSRIFGPRVVISIPSGITAVEKRAVLDSAERAGARKVFLLEEPMAAAMGAKLPFDDAVASMVVDIGGGTSEIAILSLADIAKASSLRVAGDDFDEAIIVHLEEKRGLRVGEQTAEQIKIRIGSAWPLEQELAMKVRGRDVSTGLPRQIEVNSVEVREALSEPLKKVCDEVVKTLREADPELAADLCNPDLPHNGITVAGGGALLRGIDKLFANRTGLVVKIAEDPLTCVARGTADYLENLEQYKAILESNVEEL
jgi:rod shape-determining protein MreB